MKNMKQFKMAANGLPMPFKIEVANQPDGTVLARMPGLPGMFFHGETVDETAKRAGVALSLLAFAAKTMETSVTALWNEAEQMIVVEVGGEVPHDQFSFTGAKAGSA